MKKIRSPRLPVPDKIYRVKVECHINVKAGSVQHAKEVAELDTRYAIEYTRYTNPATHIVDHALYDRHSFLAKKAELITPVKPVANE